MKQWLLVLIFLFSTEWLIAQDKGIGVGVVLGDPTGITSKMWLDGRSALSVTAGYDFRSVGGTIHLNLDYFYHPWIVALDQGNILVYLGPGVGLGLHSKIGLTLRAPAGITYHFESYPLETFLEIIPALEITGPVGTGGWLGSYLGARWYFNKI